MYPDPLYRSDESSDSEEARDRRLSYELSSGGGSIESASPNPSHFIDPSSVTGT